MRVRLRYTVFLFLALISAAVGADLGRRAVAPPLARPTPPPATSAAPAAAAASAPTSTSTMLPRSSDNPDAHTDIGPATIVPPRATLESQPPQSRVGAQYALIQYPARSVSHGHGLVIIGQIAYTIDGGQLRALPLESAGRVQTLTPPGDRIDDVPVKDWIDLAAADNGALWLIDRMGDLVRYTPTTQTWRMERKIVDRFQNPGQLYVALTSYAGQAYILDEAQGQVWRWPQGERDAGYFGGIDVWQRLDQGLDITRAVDLAVDGNVYLLLREEPERGKQRPARIRLYQKTKLVWEQPESSAFERPLQLYTSDQSSILSVIDRDGLRVQELDKASGRLVASLNFDTEIRAMAQAGDQRYFLGRDRIYILPGTGATIVRHSDTPPQPARPDDLALWKNLRLLPPIAGAFLPDRDSLLPGAPRLYRFGVHQGVDFFGIASGTPVKIGAPVQASADGTVIRADNDYVELTPAKLDQLLDAAAAGRNTSATTEDLLRGRSVCIRHSGGVVTCYAHLSRIAPEINVGTLVQRGQIIAYAGNSGTAEGVQGGTGGVHLHFEVLIGEHYLGQWLSPLETRRLFEHVFGFNDPPSAKPTPPIVHETASTS